MINRSKRILITGATGFIGRHIAACLHNSYSILAVGRTNIDSPNFLYAQAAIGSTALRSILTDFNPHVVIHCAGSASVNLSVREPATDFASGPALIFALYEDLRQTKCAPLVVQISSAAVYGNPTKLPVPENAPITPLSPYGWHKFICESIGNEFAKLYGIPGLALRVFSCYGPGQNKLLLWECCGGIQAGTLRLYGTGKESRDYIHVSDLAEAVKCLLAKPLIADFMAINVASGIQTRISQVVDLLRAAMDAQAVAPVYEGKKESSVPQHWQADISLLTSYGFRPKIAFEDGVAEYAAWFAARSEI